MTTRIHPERCFTENYDIRSDERDQAGKKGHRGQGEDIKLEQPLCGVWHTSLDRRYGGSIRAVRIQIWNHSLPGISPIQKAKQTQTA